jgi:hypothetical protein
VLVPEHEETPTIGLSAMPVLQRQVAVDIAKLDVGSSRIRTASAVKVLVVTI